MDGGAPDGVGRSRPPHSSVIACSECGRPSDARWRGWRAYRSEDLETGEEPELEFFCPSCSEREFGHGSSERRENG